MNWHEYFFNMIEVVRSKSKDRSTQVGCIIVGPDKEIRTTGFNGMPRKIDETVEARHERPEKYFWFEHAERNAIYNAARIGTALYGSTVYMDLNLPICAPCARALIQVGIKEIYLDYRNEEEKKSNWRQKWKEEYARSLEMFAEAGVPIFKYYGEGKLYLRLGKNKELKY